MCHVDLGLRFEPAGKRDAPHFMAARTREHPGPDRCRFMFATKCLGGSGLVREDLDAICPDAELVVLEEGRHGDRETPKVLDDFGITDDVPGPVPGLGCHVRRDGHVTGNSFESAGGPLLLRQPGGLGPEQVGAALTRWVECRRWGGLRVVLDAGLPRARVAP